MGQPQGDDAHRVPRPRGAGSAPAQAEGIERQTWVRADGFGKCFAIADEDLEQRRTRKTSSVHFLRFELTAEMCAALKAGRRSAWGSIMRPIGWKSRRSHRKPRHHWCPTLLIEPDPPPSCVRAGAAATDLRRPIIGASAIIAAPNREGSRRWTTIQKNPEARHGRLRPGCDRGQGARGSDREIFRHPDSYPLSINGIVTGCNQLTGREPVMELSEAAVQDAIDRLIERRLVSIRHQASARVLKA